MHETRFEHLARRRSAALALALALLAAASCDPDPGPRGVGPAGSRDGMGEICDHDGVCQESESCLTCAADCGECGDAGPRPLAGDGAGAGGEAPGGDENPDPPGTPPTAPVALTFTAEADAYVDEGNAAANHGTASTLQIDQGPDQHGYLRFAVGGLGGAAASVKLRLYVTNGSASGPAVHAADSGWGETTITWSDRPAAGAKLATAGSAAKGWIEIELGAAVAGDGLHTFALLPTSSDGMDFDAREGAHPPELVLSTSGTTPPPPTSADAGTTPPPPPAPDAGTPPPPAPDAGTPPPPPPPGTLADQYAGITKWCKVQVHNHAGRFGGVAQSLAAYKSAGFDLIFLTDHDDDPQLAPISDPAVVTVRGVEISDPRHGCALGINAAHKETSYSTIQAAIDAVAAEGGIYQINHPDRDNLSAAAVTPLKNLWGMEVGNKGTRWANAEQLWDSQISQSKRVWGTFSDDAHGTSDVGRGWINVGSGSDCSQAAVLAGMKKGAFVMSNGLTLTISVSGNTISAQSSGTTLDWYKENMTKLKTTNAASGSYTLAGNEVFVRVAATNSSGKVALSQPIFTKP